MHVILKYQCSAYKAKPNLRSSSRSNQIPWLANETPFIVYFHSFINQTTMIYAHDQYQLHTADQRPDLWRFLDDPNHPLNAAWPLFLDQDPTYRLYASQLAKLKNLSSFQFVLSETDVEGHDSVITCSRSIPFFWPELHETGDRDYLSVYPEIWDTLPDGDYDTILAREIEQYLVRENRSLLSNPLTTD